MYNFENLKMSVECKSDLTESTVTDEVVVQIRKPIRTSVREGSVADRRRRLASSNPQDWTVRWPSCQPRLTTDGIRAPTDSRYLIGVDGDVYMDPIPDFAVSPFCEGIDDLSIEYWATQSNGVALPENVFFYPDTRQFRFNSNNFAQEGMLAMEMIGAIDYYIVPTECGYEELTYYYHLDIAKKKPKKKKKSGSSSRRRRNLRKLDSPEEREYFDIDSDETASESSDEDPQDAEAADDT